MSVWFTVDDVISLRVPDVITVGTSATGSVLGQHSAADINNAAYRTHRELFVLAGQ